MEQEGPLRFLGGSRNQAPHWARRGELEPAPGDEHPADVGEGDGRLPDHTPEQVERPVDQLGDAAKAVCDGAATRRCVPRKERKRGKLVRVRLRGCDRALVAC
jgi:hypothetical protein